MDRHSLKKKFAHYFISKKIAAGHYIMHTATVVYN